MSEVCRSVPFWLSLMPAWPGWPMRGNRHDRRRRRAAFDVLAERPGPLFRAFRELQIATRHVEAAGVAEHGLERVPRGDSERRRAERDDEFELEMIVRRAGGIGDRIAALPQRRRALGEVERLFAIDDMAHLAGVILVVARRRRKCARRGSVARRRR